MKRKNPTLTDATRRTIEKFQNKGKLLENDTAEDQAKAQLESIKEMVSRRVEAIKKDDPDNDREILEDALSILVRSDWHNVGEKEILQDYQILLCTGGPAVKIEGTLNSFSEPDEARIYYQDWGTPWTVYPISSEEEQTVLEYARCFYFGE